jgi:hypothetical protein
MPIGGQSATTWDMKSRRGRSRLGQPPQRFHRPEVGNTDLPHPGTAIAVSSRGWCLKPRAGSGLADGDHRLACGRDNDEPRDFRPHLECTLATELSHETISKTETVAEEVKAWQARPDASRCVARRRTPQAAPQEYVSLDQQLIPVGC